MVLFPMRRWSRLVAVLLLLGMVRLPHVAAEDPGCAPGEAGSYRPHDETQHGLRADGQAKPEHCAVCHWTRTLRSPLTPAPASVIDQASLGRVEILPPAAFVAAPVDRLPARAPPAA